MVQGHPMKYLYVLRFHYKGKLRIRNDQENFLSEDYLAETPSTKLSPE
jgi:hypothetical protein